MRNKKYISVMFLAVGVFGCHMITPASLRPLQQLNQLDFVVDRVTRQGDRLLLQGICRAYRFL